MGFHAGVICGLTAATCRSVLKTARFIAGIGAGTTKADHAQSAIMNTGKGKKESTQDYAIRFDAVQGKTPSYNETLVKNTFVWGRISLSPKLLI